MLRTSLQDGSIPILTIRLELIEKLVAFRPPLDQNTSDVSVQETVDKWLAMFLSRGRLVQMLGGKVKIHLAAYSMCRKM